MSFLVRLAITLALTPVIILLADRSQMIYSTLIAHLRPDFRLPNWWDRLPKELDLLPYSSRAGRPLAVLVVLFGGMAGGWSLDRAVLLLALGVCVKLWMHEYFYRALR